jgi:hypothetical protein
VGAVAKSYMRKSFLIYEEMRNYLVRTLRRPLVRYDFATAPFWISLYMRKILISFLSVRRRWNLQDNKVIIASRFPLSQYSFSLWQNEVSSTFVSREVGDRASFNGSKKCPSLYIFFFQDTELI